MLQKNDGAKPSTNSQLHRLVFGRAYSRERYSRPGAARTDICKHASFDLFEVGQTLHPYRSMSYDGEQKG